MLHAHSQLAVPPESSFVVAMAKRSKRHSRVLAEDYERFASELFRTPFHRWGLTREQVDIAIHEEHRGSLADAIRALYGCYAQSRGKPLFADKTPKNVLDIPVLADFFSDSRFVHIIRDGRDVALSLVEQRFGPASLSDAAMFWKRRVEQGRRAGLALDPRRYTEVRYEDLVAHPDDTLRSLCEFLGLEYETDMLSFHEHAAAIVAASSEVGDHSHLLEPLRTGIRDWRVDMSSKDVETFECIAGDLLTELSYPRWTRPTFRTRISVSRARARHVVHDLQIRASNAKARVRHLNDDLHLRGSRRIA
jgi:Sulfotransferase family